MSATLNSHINYRDGYIDIIDALDESVTVEGAEVVETGCKGWGDSNAVVRHDGNYYLATVDDDEPEPLSAKNAAKLAGLKWTTPPARQGQMVEVSYAGVSDGSGDGWILRQCHDRSDGTTSYAARAWEDGEEFEPWNGEPGGEFAPVEDGDAVLRHC